MATVTGYTAAKMDDMEKSNITGARLEIVGDETQLVLIPEGFASNPGSYPEINVGDVRGLVGPQGPIGEVSEAELTAAISAAHATGAITHSQLQNAIPQSKMYASKAGSLTSSGFGSIWQTKIFGMVFVTGQKLDKPVGGGNGYCAIGISDADFRPPVDVFFPCVAGSVNSTVAGWVRIEPDGQIWIQTTANVTSVDFSGMYPATEIWPE